MATEPSGIMVYICKRCLYVYITVVEEMPDRRHYSPIALTSHL